jgi:hypothetical protein
VGITFPVDTKKFRMLVSSVVFEDEECATRIAYGCHSHEESKKS